jgi:excisionase family DNA binding protein
MGFMSGKSKEALDERRAFRVNDFCALYSISRSSAYKLMAEGKLRTVRVGGRRLIPKESAEALLSSTAVGDARAKPSGG